MVSSKDFQAVKIDVNKMITELNNTTSVISKKLGELRNSEDLESLKVLAKAYNSLEASKREATMSMMNKELGKLVANLLKTTKEAQCLKKRVDEFEEKHLKYNVPCLDECSSFDDYLKKLQEFMRIWEKEAEKGRRKGEKSLIEWLQQIHQSQHEERKSTLEAMKKVVIDLGTKISNSITDFLLFAVVLGIGKLVMNDFEAMLKQVSVEKNSIFIKNFLSVIKLVERTTKETHLVDSAENDLVGKDIEFKIMDMQFGLMRMIFKEVLRLEVALCCPDLPMVLTDDVYLLMGSHLRNFFDNKLRVVSLKMSELKQLVFSSIQHNIQTAIVVNYVKEIMVVEVQNTWNKLDLQYSS